MKVRNTCSLCFHFDPTNSSYFRHRTEVRAVTAVPGEDSNMHADWRPPLPLLLSLNAGFVDTAGFLALQGLFTAHVTGNFVTLGASLVFGTSGAVAKLWRFRFSVWS